MHGELMRKPLRQFGQLVGNSVDKTSNISNNQGHSKKSDNNLELGMDMLRAIPQILFKQTNQE